MSVCWFRRRPPAYIGRLAFASFPRAPAFRPLYGGFSSLIEKTRRLAAMFGQFRDQCWYNFGVKLARLAPTYSKSLSPSSRGIAIVLVPVIAVQVSMGFVGAIYY